ncbi:MAG: hypothetical protein JJE13_01585 [Thermoleophilia bacterium]|nr:hypothetical protein [Thermoleophilia bacterium]
MSPGDRPQDQPGRVPGFLDLGLIALAAGYIVFVGISGVGPHLYASADRVSDGRVWLLATSSLDVANTLSTIQWILLTAAVIVVIFRLGPRIWWLVALTGHIGAAILSYAVIEIAIALGSQSADHTAAQGDYGISIVLAATLGALTASALPFRRGPGDRMDTGDRAALWLGLLGLAGLVAVSIGWYDVQHLLGYGIGFFLAGILRKKTNWVGFDQKLNGGLHRSTQH